MFGLTRREQYWREQRKGAEMLTLLAKSAIEATASVRVAEVQAVLTEERVREIVREELAKHSPDAGVEREEGQP